jgi:hypothetical protein
MCNNCVNWGDYCVLSSQVVCQAYSQHKVQCLFLDGKWKHKDKEVNSEDGELRPKNAKVAVTRPLGSKPTVEILAGPSRITDRQSSFRSWLAGSVIYPRSPED